jgi:hypothetical protein
LHLPDLPGSGSGGDELRTIAEKLSEMFGADAKQYAVGRAEGRHEEDLSDDGLEKSIF